MKVSNLVGGGRPKTVTGPGTATMEGSTNELATINSIRERQVRNRVQFNLGPSSTTIRNPNPKSHKTTTLRPIPELLKTNTKTGRVIDFPVLQNAAAGPFLKPSRTLIGEIPGIPQPGDSDSNSNTLISSSNNQRGGRQQQQLEQIPQQLTPSQRSTVGDLSLAEVSLTRLVSKPRVKGNSMHRRNLSKVAYTYQAVIRPSSPSYMQSTSASRNRSSNSSKLSSFLGSSGTVKSGRVQKTNQQQRLQPLQSVVGLGGSTSSQSSTSGASVARGSPSNKTLGSKSRNSRKFRKKSRFRLSSSRPDLGGHHSSTVSVVLKEKFLMRIFSNLSWNELLAIRWTCKKWYEIISTEAPLKKEGVILLRRNLEGMPLFNKSMYVWTQFRIFVSVVFDFTDPMQQEFWLKHGKTMSYLEIRNSSMTLSALVEILSRCPNLEHFLVTWTAEMYSFNSEMIKKYYGIHFRNGTFVKLHELTIDKSYFLTDNALWSLLKWCGGSIHRLALTCGPDDHEDTLSRLKPRWSIEPIQNYTSRFGYSGNFKFLDFSGSNLNSENLKTLARTEKLNSLIGIRLSNCKITDESISYFIERKGGNLEEFSVDNTSITEKAFLEGSTKLPRLKILNISGRKGNFHNLDFLPYLKSLEEFLCYETHWLTYSTLAKPIEGLGQKNKVKKLDISSSNNIISRVDQRMNKIWFSHLTNILPRLTQLNLNYCGNFGNDDNFKAICTNIPSMEKLSVRDWTSLTDEALVGMSFDDIIKQYDDVRGFWRDTDTALKISPVICNLKFLKYLDLGGCKKLTDICVQFAIIHLPRLAKLGLDKSQITDASFQLLISKSYKLEKLCLLGCEHVSPKANFFTRSNGRLVFIGKI